MKDIAIARILVTVGYGDSVPFEFAGLTMAERTGSPIPPHAKVELYLYMPEIKFDCS